MLDLLFEFIFKIICTLAEIIITPLVNGLLLLYPDLSYGFNIIYQFADTCFQCIPVILDNMLIPRPYILALVDYYVIKYSIYLVKKVFNLTMNIYNYLKP